MKEICLDFKSNVFHQRNCLSSQEIIKYLCYKYFLIKLIINNVFLHIQSIESKFCAFVHSPQSFIHILIFNKNNLSLVVYVQSKLINHFHNVKIYLVHMYEDFF